MSAQISQEGSDSDCSTRVVENSELRKHSICTHFPKDRSCDKSLRTKFTRSPFRRHVGEGSIPLVEKFGGLITVNHKILDEEGESQNNHRYAVVIQDLDTQQIQSNENSLRKFLEPSQKPKVIYMDNSLECGKSCEEFSWNHRTSTRHRSETNGRHGEKELLLYCCNRAWMKNGLILWNALLSAKCPRPPARRENSS